MILANDIFRLFGLLYRREGGVVANRNRRRLLVRPASDFEKIAKLITYARFDALVHSHTVA